MGNSVDKTISIRVIKIQENSPASKTNLKPFIDFIVGVYFPNGFEYLTRNNVTSLSEIDSNSIKLYVFDLIADNYRTIELKYA